MITKESLVQAGAEKLADILLEIYRKNESIQPQLDVVFSALNNDVQNVVTAIEEQFSIIDVKFYNCSEEEVDNLVKYLKLLRENITEQLAPLSAIEAVRLMKRFIELHNRIFFNVSDEGDVVSGALLHACQDIPTLFKKAGSSLDEITEFIMRRIADNSTSDFDEIIPCFQEVLGIEGLDLLQQKLEMTLNSGNEKDIINVLMCLADLRNDVNAYIKASSLTSGKREVKDHIEIARRLLEHSRLHEALNWLDSICLSEKKYYEDEIIPLKVKIYDNMGKPERAQIHRIQLFHRHLNRETYDEILGHHNGQICARTAMRKVSLFSDVQKGLSFLLDMKNTQAISKLIRERLNDIDGRLHKELSAVASVLMKSDPLGATLLYRKLIEAILEERRVSSYVHGIRHLLQCESLSQSINSWEKYEHHKVYKELLKQRFKTRKNFWCELKCELDKVSS